MKTRKLAALIMSLIITMSFVLSGCGNTEVVTSSNLSSTLDNSSSLDVSYSSILGEEETTSFVNSSEGSTSASKGSTTTSKQSGTNNNTNTNNGSSTSSYQAVVKPANLQETPPKFATGYITKEKTYIETKYVIFEIDANIYVVGDLAAKADEVCAAVEQVTGLSFNTNITGGKKVLVYVTREGIVGDEEYSTIIPNAVSGQVTSSRGDSCMSYMYLDPVCLFLGKSSAFLHEMSHVLRFAQSSVMFGTVLEEGFGSYVEYHTLQYLEKKGSATAYSLDSSLSVLRDIHFGEHLYKNTMDFWLAQTADYYRPNGNDNYAIGLRLLSYLKEKQGSAFSWIKQSNTLSDSDLIKSVYGKNVLNGFYNWVKQNDLKFFVDGSTYSPDTVDAANMVGLAPISIYPRFLQEYNETTLSYFSFNYKDLYINIEEARRYLSLYKNRNVDNLYLSLSDSSKVYLFDKNGKALESLKVFSLVRKGNLDS